MLEPSMLEVGDITIFLETDEVDQQLWLVGRLLTVNFEDWKDALVELRQTDGVVTAASIDQSAYFRCRLTNKEPFDLRISSRSGKTLVIEAVKLIG